MLTVYTGVNSSRKLPSEGMQCQILKIEWKAFPWKNCYSVNPLREARWPSCRASDSEARGQEFDPHSGRHVCP